MGVLNVQRCKDFTNISCSHKDVIYLCSKNENNQDLFKFLADTNYISQESDTILFYRDDYVYIVPHTRRWLYVLDNVLHGCNNCVICFDKNRLISICEICGCSLCKNCAFRIDTNCPLCRTSVY